MKYEICIWFKFSFSYNKTGFMFQLPITDRNELKYRQLIPCIWVICYVCSVTITTLNTHIIHMNTEKLVILIWTSKWTTHRNVKTLLMFSIEGIGYTVINILIKTNFQCFITLYFQQNLDIMDNDTLFRSYLMPGHRLYFITHGFLENGHKEWIKVS